MQGASLDSARVETGDLPGWLPALDQATRVAVAGFGRKPFAVALLARWVKTILLLPL